jgi:CheY-like chemotaxis protein
MTIGLDYFLATGSFFACRAALARDAKRFASGLRSPQSVGGKETRQNRGLGPAISTPISATPFVPGGEAALSLLEVSPFDVIVTDLRMPGMDGATLFELVREKYLSTLRIILSRYTELQASLRTVPVAHRFLLTPCDSEMLRAGIARATSLGEVLDSKMLTSLVGALRDPSSLPHVYSELKVSHHHYPSRVPVNGLDMVLAVYVCNLLTHEREAPPAFDMELLQQGGSAQRLPEWPKIAEAAQLNQAQLVG